MKLRAALASSRAARRLVVLTAAASMGVAGLTLSAAGGATTTTSPLCASAQQTYLSTTDAATRQALANWLVAAGCTVPTGNTSTSSSSTSSTVTSTPQNTGTLAQYCNALAAQLASTTDPAVRNAITASMTAAHCSSQVTSTG